MDIEWTIKKGVNIVIFDRGWGRVLCTVLPCTSPTVSFHVINMGFHLGHGCDVLAVCDGERLITKGATVDETPRGNPE